MRRIERLKTHNKKKRIHWQALGKYRKELNRIKGNVSSKRNRSKSCRIIRPMFVRALYPGNRLCRHLRVIY